MSRKGMEPSSLDSSLVNWMLASMELICSRNSCLWDDLMMTNVSSTNLFQNAGDVELIVWLLFLGLPYIG